jgi:hypothetical protein
MLNVINVIRDGHSVLLVPSGSRRGWRGPGSVTLAGRGQTGNSAGAAEAWILSG